MKKTSTLLVAIGSIGALALSACGASDAQAPAPKGVADTIRITLDVPTSLDPVDALGLPDYITARASFDTLVRKDDSGLVPGLAASWETTPVGADFIIREGATCSDGTPITATVVKNSLDYLAEKDGPNGPSTFGGQIPVITANDDAQLLSIELETPWPALVQSLSVAASGVICPAGLENIEQLRDGHIEGAESGPYVLTDSKPGVYYEYTLRDEYDLWPEWTTDVEGKPAKTVRYVVSADTSAASNLVLDGQLDIAKIMEESIDRFDESKGYKVSNFDFGDYFLIFNERESSPFADESLRRAVVQTINREAFTDVATSGLGAVAKTFVKPNSQCVAGSDFNLLPYEPESASMLNGVKIRLVGPNVIGTNGAGNTFVQEMLREAGAEVELENVDVGTWISKVYNEPGSWDVTVFADLDFLGSLFHPALNFVGPSTLDGGTNLVGVQDSDVEKAFEGAIFGATETEQCSAIREVTDLVTERAHGAPLSVEPYLYVQRPGVSVSMLGGSLDDQILRITDERQ